MDREKKLFYLTKSYSITDLRGYRLFHCTVAPMAYYCHSVLRHQCKTLEVNFEELDVLFDQLVEGNSGISLGST